MPRIGYIGLGISSSFFVRRVGITPPDGEFTTDCTIDCGAALGVPIYAQAYSFDCATGQGFLSETVATMFWDQDGDCALGAEGCTPSTWADPDNLGQWPAPYEPETCFQDVFGIPSTDATLLEALGLEGKMDYRLMREATAALLNAADPHTDYPLTVDQVLFLFELSFYDGYGRAQLSNSLVAYNCLGCSLQTGHD